MRDVSPPSGLSGDDQGDTPAAGLFRVPPGRDDGPRHMASATHRRNDAAAGGDTWRRSTDSGDTLPSSDDQPSGDRKWHSLGKTVVEWAVVIGCGVLIAVTAQAFFVQAFWIPSPSMAPTLEIGDRVLVNKLSYKTHDVHRGDLVVFERPPQASNGADGEIRDLIKRVIAVGGDTVEGRDGQVYVNGERIEEPYLVPGTPTERLERQQIPEGHVFVMGDNRLDSEDSRVFGPIDEGTIVGRAFVKVLPFTDVGWL